MTPSPRPLRITRVVLVLYLSSLFLLPWTWFPPFPWLHEHAQWSDAVFAAAAVMWAIERWRLRLWRPFRAAHAGIALYFLCAALSLLFATPNPQAGALKLLGVAELCILAFITSDLAARPGVSRNITRAVAMTSLVNAAAAVAGLLLFYSGVSSPLIGIYGELEASRWYARVQAGTYNPNLLASFCIFAAAIVSRRDEALPPWLRRVVLAALWLSVLFTFSRGILGFIASAAIRNARTPARKKLAAATAVACVILVISATMWKPKIDPSRPLETRFEQHPSSRLQAAKSSLLTLVAHPLFGSGLNTSPGIYQGASFDAHFTLLNIAATLGLPALIAFSFLIAALWRKRRRPTDLAVWGGLAGLALDGLGQDIEDFRHVWVMIGVVDARRADGRRPR